MGNKTNPNQAGSNGNRTPQQNDQQSAGSGKSSKTGPSGKSGGMGEDRSSSKKARQSDHRN